MDNVYIDQTALGYNQIIKSIQERTIVLRLVSSIPTPGQPPEEIFKECCYTHLTLADKWEDENDYLFCQDKFHQTIRIVAFRSTNEHPLIDDIWIRFYGSFPTNNNLKLFGDGKVLAE
jgi:hypothetical protein